MGLGGEVQHRVGLVLSKDPIDRRAIRDVRPFERVAGVRGHFRQVLEVACIGEQVEDDDAGVGLREREANEVRTDETGPSGDDPGAHGQT